MRRVLASLLLSVAACGGGESSSSDAGVDASSVDAVPPIDAIPPNDANPTSLASTGLCVDPACQTISPDVRLYTPRWALWSDGAEKRRWIWLPPGTKIDTANMNAWRFPVGTKLWKEFTRDGVRVETRIYSKLSNDPNDIPWDFVAYVWNEDQSEAFEARRGLADALGTPHDVPSRSQCIQCHEGTPEHDRVLGFSALQLDYDAPDGQLDLADLVAGELLTAPPTKPATQAAYFPFAVADTATNAQATRDVLGYLHSNCGHCHNPQSGIRSRAFAELRLDVTKVERFADTQAYTSLIGKPGARAVTHPDGGLRTLLVVPGRSRDSILFARFARETTLIKMPPEGTEDADSTMVPRVQAWIDSLTP